MKLQKLKNAFGPDFTQRELGTNVDFHDIKLYPDDPKVELSFSKLLLASFSPVLKRTISENEDTHITFAGYSSVDLHLFIKLVLSGECVARSENNLLNLRKLLQTLQCHDEIQSQNIKCEVDPTDWMGDSSREGTWNDRNSQKVADTVDKEYSIAVKDNFNSEEEAMSYSDASNDDYGIDDLFTTELEDLYERKSIKRSKKSKNIDFSDRNYFSCAQCNKRIISRWNLMIHMAEHVGQSAYKCVTCSATITGRVVLNKHVKEHQTESFEVIKHKPADPVYQNCDHCGKRVKGLFSFVQHLAQHVGQSAYACHICGKVYMKRESWNHHRIHHTKPKPVKTECDICGKKFRDVPGHKSMAHGQGDEARECPICHKRVRKHLVNNHIKVVHEKRVNYVCCDECGKIFPSKSKLKQHRMVHHGDKKPYPCDRCDKSFMSPGLLQAHVNAHMSIRDHLCSHCGKGFPSARDLQQHQRNHNKSVYLCKICNKTVSEKQIRGHMVLHTDLKPFVCTICGITFKHRTSATRHVHNNHGQKKGSIKYVHTKEVENLIVNSAEKKPENDDGENKI